MRRLIKFRGKSLDTGEWHYGFSMYWVHDQRHRYEEGKTTPTYYTVPELVMLQGSDLNEPMRNFDKVVIIDPCTVGQFTGLTDYNGNDIYEGDILDISAINLPSRAIVAYRGGAFVLTDVDGCVIDPIYGYDTDAFEVIGNIHDNQDLINH